MTVDREYEDLLNAIRSAYSHKMPGAADFELLKACMKAALKQDEKQKGMVDKPRVDKIGKNGKISRSVTRTVRKRDQGKCQWRSEDGGICGSTYGAQKVDRFRKRPRQQAPEPLQSRLEFTESQ